MMNDDMAGNPSVDDLDLDTITVEEADEPFDIRGDALLNLLVHLAEKGAGAYVTLFSSGLVFSGILTSRRTFFEENVAFLGPDNSMRVVFEEFIAALEDRTDDDLDAPDYAYVHLRDARTFVPGQNGLPANGSLMRIARADIIGWSMGKYQTEQR